jgi:hypothetical protein
VASDKVNAVSGQSSIMSVKVAATRNSGCYFSDNTAIAAQKPTDDVAVATVPLGP